jgi:DNA-binding MurR/RpiR family transcriptional regulator
MDRNIKNKIKTMLPFLNEKQKRIYLATEAEAIGHGGISEISRISGVSRVTISRGIEELKLENVSPESIRKKGGGRKKNN